MSRAYPSGKTVRTVSISPLRTSASSERRSSRPGTRRIVAQARSVCHPARRAGIAASHDRGVDAVRLRQLGVLGDRSGHHLPRLLRRGDRRQRRRPRRLLVGAGRLRRHDRGRAHLPPARRHRRSRRRAQAVLHRLHAGVGRRHRAARHPGAGHGRARGSCSPSPASSASRRRSSTTTRICPGSPGRRRSAGCRPPASPSATPARSSPSPSPIRSAAARPLLGVLPRRRRAVRVWPRSRRFSPCPATGVTRCRSRAALARGLGETLTTLREILRHPDRLQMRRFLTATWSTRTA